MSFWLRFALRSCLRRRRRTAITLLGIAFGIAALVVLGATMVGVNDTMIQNSVAMNAGHVVSRAGPMPMAVALEQGAEWIKAVAGEPEIEGALARCTFPAIVRSSEGTSTVEVWAVNPDEERRFTPIAERVVSGRYLQAPKDLLLGRAVAEALGVAAGDTVTIVTPEHSYARELTGTYDTGVETFDSRVAFISRENAATLGETQVMRHEAFFLGSGADCDAVRAILAARAQGGTALETWRESLPEVAQLVELNGLSMRIMILLAVVILGFGVSNALLMSVMDRYRQFAVLKAMGVRPGEVVVLVEMEAIIMCLAAGVVGTLVGAAIAAAWGRVGLDLTHYTSHNPHFSIDPIIYPRVSATMTLLPQALALVGGIVSALWPATVAARRSVSGGMRDL